MPVITINDLKSLIVTKVRDTDLVNGPVAPNINLIWDMFADKAVIAPRLQFLYALKEAVSTMIGWSHEYVTFITDRVEVDNSDQLKYWTELQAETQAEIDKVELMAAATRPGQIAAMKTTEIIDANSDPSTSGGPDAGHRRYRGDPYYPISRYIRSGR